MRKMILSAIALLAVAMAVFFAACEPPTGDPDDTVKITTVKSEDTTLDAPYTWALNKKIKLVFPAANEYAALMISGLTADATYDLTISDMVDSANWVLGDCILADSTGDMITYVESSDASADDYLLEWLDNGVGGILEADDFGYYCYFYQDTKADEVSTAYFKAPATGEVVFRIKLGSASTDLNFQLILKEEE